MVIVVMFILVWWAAAGRWGEDRPLPLSLRPSTLFPLPLYMYQYV